MGATCALLAAILGLLSYTYHLGLAGGERNRTADKALENASSSYNSKPSWCNDDYGLNRRLCNEDSEKLDLDQAVNLKNLSLNIADANRSFAMSIIAFLQLIVSAGGFYILWRTVRLSEEANKIAWSGDRAWIKIESIEAHDIAILERDGKFHLIVFVTTRLKNYGNSPAVDVFVSAICWTRPC